MKIGIISKASEYTHSVPVMDQMADYVRRAGIEIERIVPEDQLIDLAAIKVEHDMYVIRPGIELGLSLSGILHEQGAHMVNSHESSSLVADKVRVTHRLMQGGIPTARSYLAGQPEIVSDALGGSTVIVKPHRGSYGEGIRVIHPQDLTEDLSSRGGHFIQEFLPSDGLDLKVYVIGDEVFAIKRPFPATSFEDKLGTPYSLNDGIRNMALKVGELFGLDIYGLDIVETEQGPYVIDVNYFPGFIGIKSAPRLLADFLIQSVTERIAA
jgi:ribosomal protein S6--L-glutamate ligase